MLGEKRMNPLRRNRIKELRKDHRLTQDDLAEYMGVTRTQVSKWERGEQTFNNEQAWRLAGIFHCRPGDLFEKPPEKPRTPPSDPRLDEIAKLWPSLDEGTRAALFRVGEAAKLTQKSRRSGNQTRAH